MQREPCKTICKITCTTKRLELLELYDFPISRFPDFPIARLLGCLIVWCLIRGTVDAGAK